MINRINLSDFQIKETLGVGGFGRVRLAEHRTERYCVALKILKKAELVKKKQVDHVISELRVLRVFDHPFVVNLRGLTQDSVYLVFALEYVPGGELFSYLRRAGKFESSTAAVYAAQVVCVFEYMHSQDIVYRDLKPENLLLDSQGYLKLTDFGFAKFLSSGRTFTLCGTPGYLAPEVLLTRGHGKPVDWWALGVLINEMISGSEPFTADDPMGVYRQILSGKVSYPRDFSKEA
jgi:serine/threonine protein kinase